MLYDRVVPSSNARAQVLKDQIRGRTRTRAGTSRGFARSADGRALYQYDRMIPPDARSPGAMPALLRLSALRSDEHGDVRELRVARVAEWDGDRWILHSGWVARILEDNSTEITEFAEMADARIERPDYFAAERTEPELMAFAEYRRYVDEQDAAGYPTEGLRVELHRKLAFPAASLVLVCVGLPFAFTTGRRGALYGMGISIIVAVAWYAADAAFTNLGTAAYLPPMVAAWAPNVLFGLGGVYLLLHVRT